MSTDSTLVEEPVFISVILPVYNGEKTLESSLESLLAQQYAHFEIIILDDCSKDGTGKIVSSLIVGDARVSYYRNEENRGLFPTLNRGVELASGTVIKLWAQDDIMKPGCLNAFAKAHEMHPDSPFAWCQSDLIGINDSWKSLLDAHSSDCNNITVEKWSRPKIVQHFFYCGSLHGNISLLSFRKEVHDSVGGFKPLKYSGDIDFTRLALENGDPLCIPFQLVWLRNHAGQLSKSLNHLHIETRETLEVFGELMKDFEKELGKYPRLKSFIHRCFYERILRYHLANAWLILKKGKWNFALQSLMSICMHIRLGTVLRVILNRIPKQNRKLSLSQGELK